MNNVLIIGGSYFAGRILVEELQKGFYYGEKILRPARVKIARKKAAPEPPAAEETAEAEQSGADQEQEEK